MTIEQALDPETETGSVDQQRADLAELLGLAEPVPADVLLSAVSDREYARNLLLCKDAPVMLNFLLASPPHRGAVATEAAAGQPPVAEPLAVDHSTGQLLGAASKSFWAWTKSGFAVVDEATYQRRYGTCLECPDLVEPPRKRIYQIIGAADAADSSKVCQLCGCVASKKARLPHEGCPAEHAELAGMNRWGEPMVGHSADQPAATGTP
jgi:hypothetical protein